MQVKVFESPDMATGLKMVRNELGADALILSTRSVRSSKLGILGKSRLEITAAVDEPPAALNNNRLSFSQATQRELQTPYYSRKTITDSGNSKSSDNLFTLAPTGKSLQTRTSPEHPRDPQPVDTKLYGNKELDELKSMIRTLSKEVSLLKSAPDSEATVDNISIDSHRQPDSPKRSVLKMLDKYGVSPETSTIVAELALASFSADELSDPIKITAFLQEMAAGFVHVCPPDFEAQTCQSRIALVGPTGVGKTTTLAKIAAQCIGRFNKSVAFITIDTYRIAAVEQLKVYGEIMGVPVDVVLTPSQFKKAIDHHRDKDVILIDTAGRSPKDKISIEELSTFLLDELAIEKHLVLSAATREAESIEAISHFQKLNLDRTIFTKIDECTNLGVILNTQLNNPNPLSYLTNGQRVPEDLLHIDRDTVARLVIPSIQGTIS